MYVFKAFSLFFGSWKALPFSILFSSHIFQCKQISSFLQKIYYHGDLNAGAVGTSIGQFPNVQIKYAESVYSFSLSHTHLDGSLLLYDLYWYVIPFSLSVTLFLSLFFSLSLSHTHSQSIITHTNSMIDHMSLTHI